MPYICDLAAPQDFERFIAPPSVWFHPMWMSAVAELHDASAQYLSVHEHQNLVAIIPIYIKKWLLKRKAYNPVMAYYSPIRYFLPLTGFPNKDLIRRHEINNAIATFLKKEFSTVSLNLHPENIDMRGFTWNGFGATPLYTFTQNCHENPLIFAEERAKLRIAERQNYSFERRFDFPQFCDLLYKLYDLKNHDFGISAPRLLEFLQKVEKTGLIRQYNIVSHGEIHCADILICDGSDTAYALLRATSDKSRKLGASGMQNIMSTKAVADEYSFMDFLGGNVPGPARFKASFGYQLKMFFRITL